MMDINEEEKQTGICKKIDGLIKEHVKRDKTGLIRAVIFWSETRKR